MKTIFNKYMKNKKFKKMYKKEEKALIKSEEGSKSYSSVEEMLKDMHKNWTILDYLESYWYRYFWNYVERIIPRIRTFIQRGIRGWAISDTWSFDYYLAKVIAEGCQHLKNNSYHELHEQKDFNTIIQTFKTAIDILEYRKYYISSEEFTWAKYKKAIRFHKTNDKKYNQDCHVMTLREVKRFEKGFDLFKKYFFGLWD